MANNQSTPKTAAKKPAKTQALKPLETTGPSVAVRDAWDQVVPALKGIEELLGIGTDSDEGFSGEALMALQLAMQEIIRGLNVVDTFFNPGDEENHFPE